MALPEDIIAKVRQDFSEGDKMPILERLSELQKEDSQLFFDRILRCLVFLARGKVEDFESAVKLARRDWRDVISAAEYGSGNLVRHLSLPFGTYPEAEVFKKWLVGRQILVPLDTGCDDKWIIEYQEIREMSVERVGQMPVEKMKDAASKVLDPNLRLAQLRFLCIRGDKAINDSNAFEAKASILYRHNRETNRFEFQEFLCRKQDVRKRGKW